MCEKGYKSIRVEEITQRVGVSKSLFYSLFSSKEEFVLQALIEQQSTFYELISTEMSRENYPIETHVYSFTNLFDWFFTRLVSETYIKYEISYVLSFRCQFTSSPKRREHFFFVNIKK